MNEELIAKLRAEIEADVDGQYAGKTSKELVDLINNPFLVEEARPTEVAVEPLKETVTIKKEAPVFRVIMGIPGAPNAVTEEDIIRTMMK